MFTVGEFLDAFACCLKILPKCVCLCVGVGACVYDCDLVLIFFFVLFVYFVILILFLKYCLCCLRQNELFYCFVASIGTIDACSHFV